MFISGFASKTDEEVKRRLCSENKELEMWLAWYRESLAPDNHDALRLKEARLPKITGSSPQLHKRR